MQQDGSVRGHRKIDDLNHFPGYETSLWTFPCRLVI